MQKNELVKVTPQQAAIIRVLKATERATAWVVSNAEDAQQMADSNRDLAIRIDQVKAVHKEMLSPAVLIKDIADKYCKPAIEDMEEARKIQRAKLLEWDQQEKARIAEENRKIEERARAVRAEAERKAAEERAAADAKAAALRRQAEEAEERERKALAEGNAKAAALAAKEKAKAESSASVIMEKSERKAETLMAEASAKTYAMAPAVAATKIAGTSVRDNWVGKLGHNNTMDQARMMIIRAAATDSPELAALLIVDEKAITKLAKALKGQMRVPGFISVNEPIMAGARK